jgi:cytochrome c oxidase subunit II
LRARATLLLLAPIAASCSRTGPQHMLDPRGPAASDIAFLWWLFLGLSTVAFLLIMGLLAWALFRPRDREVAMGDDAARRFVLIGAVAVPAVLLLILIGVSTGLGSRIAAPPPGPLMTIDVTGHQFWWEVRYRDERPYREFRTANELHIPVGEPVLINLRSVDVVHSFWVPNLHGKLDMLPGRDNALVLRADEPGVYRGQCAEFCGVQHAKMAFYVVAHAPADFALWRERQLRPAGPPADSAALHGYEVFMQHGCAACHAIRGTPAFASVGPDLTHFGLRLSVAAGTLPNTPGHLGGWIADPQGIKPGNLMPAMALTGPDLNAVIHYLLGLGRE